MKTLLVPAQLTGMTRKRDNTVSYKFSSNVEISNEDFSLSDKYLFQNGYMAFQMNEFEGHEIPKEEAQTGEKTHSQRLRAALYVKHTKSGGTNEDFQAYYNRTMEGFIQAVKDAIPEE